MSKATDLLAFCKEHVGEWCCSVCGSNSNQPAATFRELKNAGWQFEECGHQRWGKQMFCARCGTERTHYKLLSLEQGAGITRDNLTTPQRKRIRDLLSDRDAFSDSTAVSSAEVDHKEPFRRLREKGCPDINPDDLSDRQIAEHYQILTRDHNLLKDRECEHCQRLGVRPPFFGIMYWYEGDERYRGECKGCGYFDGAEWRRRLNEHLQRG